MLALVLAACAPKASNTSAAMAPATPAPATPDPATTWPFAGWKSAKAYTFNFFAYGPGYQERVYDPDQGWVPSIRSTHELSLEQALAVQAKVHEAQGSFPMSKCPFPRHAVVYFDEGDQPVAMVNVCFECGDLFAWPDFEDVEVADKSEAAYERAFAHLKALFGDELGEPISWKEDPGTPPVNRYNWRRHPQIVAIRKITEEVEGLSGEGDLRKKEKDTGCMYDNDRTLFISSQGHARKYVVAGGSGDSSVTRTLYYDAEGRLRFVFVEAGAVNGSALEHRVYFNEKGERIWETHEYTEGPGYTFPHEWPDEDLPRDPVAAFRSECSD